MITAITVFYIIPAILSVFVILNKTDDATVGDLIIIIGVSLMPLLNLFAGYIGGLIWFCTSKSVNKFLNKRIK